MRVSLTILPDAVAFFEQKTKTWGRETRPIFIINYNNEDCGCAVNGVIQIQIVDANEFLTNESDWIWFEVKPETFQAVFPRKACWYFDEPLHLDYLPSKQQFRLVSDQQVYL